MAIVFVSAKAKQAVFFRTTAILVISTLLVAFLVFIITGLWGSGKMAIKGGPGQPDIAINLNIADSAKISNLEPFYSLETEFAYLVLDENQQQVEGNISAFTKEEAQKSLESSGFKVLNLKEAGLGRNQPFISY